MSFVNEPCLLKASDSWLCIHICIPKMYSKGFYVYMHEYAGLYVNIHVCTCVTFEVRIHGCIYLYIFARRNDVQHVHVYIHIRICQMHEVQIDDYKHM